MSDTPMPMDFNQLAFTVGNDKLRILQLEYQCKILSDEVVLLRSKHPVPENPEE